MRNIKTTKQIRINLFTSHIEKKKTNKQKPNKLQQKKHKTQKRGRHQRGHLYFIERHSNFIVKKNKKVSIKIKKNRVLCVLPKWPRPSKVISSDGLGVPDNIFHVWESFPPFWFITVFANWPTNLAPQNCFNLFFFYPIT